MAGCRCISFTIRWVRNSRARSRNWRPITRKRSQREFGIAFDKLFTITNQPIARFAEDLRKQGKWDEYLELLANAFNPATVEGLMCRSTLSVGYRGELFRLRFQPDARNAVAQWRTA